MTRSFMSLYRADLVIDPTNVLSTRIALPPARYPTHEAQTAFFRQLEEQFGGLARAARDASEPGDCPAHRITCQRVSLLERACERRVAPPLPAGDPPISKTVR